MPVPNEVLFAIALQMNVAFEKYVIFVAEGIEPRDEVIQNVKHYISVIPGKHSNILITLICASSYYVGRLK